MEKRERVLWNKQILLNNQSGGLEKIDFHEYLNDREWIKKSFEAIIKYGAVLIENVPPNSKEILKEGPIINSIDSVVVSDSLLISDRAYTCLSLEAHNDNVFLKNSAW
jgi:hypothetical protein